MGSRREERREQGGEVWGRCGKLVTLHLQHLGGVRRPKLLLAMWGIYLKIVFCAASTARFTARLAFGVNVDALLTRAEHTVTLSLWFWTSVAPPSLRAAVKISLPTAPSKVALLPRVLRCSDITRCCPCFHSCRAPCQRSLPLTPPLSLRQGVTEVRAGSGRRRPRCVR